MKGDIWPQQEGVFRPGVVHDLRGEKEEAVAEFERVWSSSDGRGEAFPSIWSGVATPLPR